MGGFDWNDLRYFLEMVRAGSASNAGRRLKADHTTVRRHISSLEEALGTQLFSKDKDFELTPQGDQLIKYAETIEGLTSRIQEHLSDADLTLSGTVRVGATDVFGTYFLSSRLSGFLEQNQELKLELIAMPRVFNLARREADIAVVVSRPKQTRQIIRKLTDFRVGLYATRDYLADHPPITALADLSRHMVITYVQDILEDPELDYLSEFESLSVGGSFESTSISSQIQAALAGIGLCVLPRFVASLYEDLVPVLPDVIDVSREFWLVMHPEMINLARVRVVADTIIELVQNERAVFIGAALSQEAPPIQRVGRAEG